MSLRVSTLVLLVLVSILLPTDCRYGQKIGDECDILVSCTPMKNCSIYNGKIRTTEIFPPDICKMTVNETIVCCLEKFVTTASTSSSTAMPIKTVKSLMFNPEIKGSLAQAKCAENAEAVYDWVRSIRVLNQSFVNMSRCALIDDDIYTMPKELLHVATLGYNTSEGTVWDCVGNLISAKIVLTTASCTKHGDLKWIKMDSFIRNLMNEDLRDKIKEKLQIIEIEEIIIHPGYDWAYSDIAILRLKHEVNYNEWVRPACLSVNSSDVREGNKVTGIGRIRSYSKGKWKLEKLIKKTVQINLDGICRIMKHIENRPICIKDNNWQIGAYDLLVGFNDHECMYNVIGIPDLFQNARNIYIGIHNYISWIEKTAWPEYF